MIAFIQDLVRAGRITPREGARLLELRRRVQHGRLSWLQRLLRLGAHVLAGEPLR